MITDFRYYLLGILAGIVISWINGSEHIGFVIIVIIILIFELLMILAEKYENDTVSEEREE